MRGEEASVASRRRHEGIAPAHRCISLFHSLFFLNACATGRAEAKSKGETCTCCPANMAKRKRLDLTNKCSTWKLDEDSFAESAEIRENLVKGTCFFRRVFVFE